VPGHYDRGMLVEILGSGGATTTPRPACRCAVCVEAREKGVPYARTGPSVFVHGPDVLFDTPEEAKLQLDRAGLDEIAACFYSHWHPDHTMGRRVWETRNGDFRGWPREAKRQRVTDVYLPEQVAADFRERLGAMAHLEFMRDRGWVRIHELADGDVVEIGGTTIRPFRLAEDYVYAFELRDATGRLLLAMDELNGWTAPADVTGCDLAVLPMGVCEHHPLTGERRIDPEHPILRFEATFAETVEIVRALEAERVVLSHVEELDGLSYDDLLVVEGRLRGEGLPVTFAHDGMRVEVRGRQS
jgi:phosphoribosyl 1,2-cyclic phosphate phosphodiesterase